jgi:L-ascorbate metabolism protein UlaG (beta-lactamase superfamily)
MIAFRMMPTDVSITWWGCASVEIRDGARVILVDPYLHPADRDADYICITHADYDHCHEPTLRRLVAEPRFELLIAAPACSAMSKLDVPHNPEPDDLAFVPRGHIRIVFPKHARQPDPRGRDSGEVELDGWQIETIESGERPERYKPIDDDTLWPALTGRFTGDQFPNIGYLITHAASGIGFLHPGDLTDAYDELRLLRGRVDYLFFPTIKLEGLELTIVDAIRPRFVVPIHYRVNQPGFPIPLEVTNDELTSTTLASGWPEPGSEPAAFRRDIHRMMRGHWYPTPDPPLARIRSLEDALRELGAELLVLEAGTPFLTHD